MPGDDEHPRRGVTVYQVMAIIYQVLTIPVMVYLFMEMTAVRQDMTNMGAKLTGLEQSHSASFSRVAEVDVTVQKIETNMDRLIGGWETALLFLSGKARDDQGLSVSVGGPAQSAAPEDDDSAFSGWSEAWRRLTRTPEPEPVATAAPSPDEVVTEADFRRQTLTQQQLERYKQQVELEYQQQRQASQQQSQHQR